MRYPKILYPETSRTLSDIYDGVFNDFILLKVVNNFCKIHHICFFYMGFFHGHSRFTGQQGNGEAISLTPLYYFHPLHGHLDISPVITAEGLTPHIASSRTRTRNLWFPSASCQPLSYSSYVL